jgi:hypothetical protein
MVTVTVIVTVGRVALAFELFVETVASGEWRRGRQPHRQCSVWTMRGSELYPTLLPILSPSHLGLSHSTALTSENLSLRGRLNRASHRLCHASSGLGETREAAERGRQVHCVWSSSSFRATHLPLLGKDSSLIWCLFSVDGKAKQRPLQLESCSLDQPSEP